VDSAGTRATVDSIRQMTVPPRAAEPGVVERVEPVTVVQTARPWNVIAHDDPITLMAYVTMVFQRVFGYSAEKATQLMMEVHSSGRALVWTGAKEQAEVYVFKLHSHQLLATLEPSEG
jgi:ATP-dependent Clp protease adaptor protein ClpS